MDKLKQLKATAHPDDDYVVLMIAGLTDVLIKSVEEGKSKLASYIYRLSLAMILFSSFFISI